MGLFDFLKNKQQPTAENTDKVPMTQKDDYKSQLDNIQKKIYTFLKPLGFKKKGRTFNRQTEEGVYQVINIQSGRYEFGDKYVIPGLRDNFYGKFTVNLGVMVKEIYELDVNNKPKDIYQEYDCQIRARLTELTIKQDYWWPISDEEQKTSEEIIEGLKLQGIEWLNMFKNRHNICENWGNVAGSAIRAKLDVALITLNTDKDKGSRLIQGYYDNIKNSMGHREYVKELAESLGVKITG